MTIGSRILMFALIISLGACATEISKVERKTVDVEGAYTVDPQITWSEFPGSSTASNGLVWTVDGLFLQRLDLFGGIEDGQALFEPTGAEEESLPIFRADMRENEVQEFVLDTLAQQGFVDVEAINLRPSDIGSRKGFRFDLVMATASGLEMKGLVAGAIVGDELNLVLYTGTRLHYFAVRQSAVEGIIKSITFKGGAA
jgi:hypothetical protein